MEVFALPVEVMILGVVITCLSLLDRLLKLSTGHTSLQFLRKKIQASKQKVESIKANSLKSASLKSSESGISELFKDPEIMGDFDELVDNLVDLGEVLSFTYRNTSPK